MHSIETLVVWGGWALLTGAWIVWEAILTRRGHPMDLPISLKESLLRSGVWIGLALLFNAGVYLTLGTQAALAFLTAYLLEKALSVDNLCVFLLIFSAFQIPLNLQHRVLSWGILGALGMRALCIGMGVVLTRSFHRISYIFGALLLLTGIKLLGQKNEGPKPQDSRWVRWYQRLIPITHGLRGARFWVREEGCLKTTPLLLVLVMVEISDVIFALDSIPAAFAVTTDPFLIYTSNAFAILGLRALYFLIAQGLHQIRYLPYGLGVILMGMGLKMLLVDVYPVPTLLSLGMMALVLAGTVWLSRMRKNC